MIEYLYMRLKAKAEGSTRLAYTGLRGGLEHLKIETRLIDERFPSVMGVSVFLQGNNEKQNVFFFPLFPKESEFTANRRARRTAYLVVITLGVLVITYKGEISTT